MNVMKKNLLIYCIAVMAAALVSFDTAAQTLTLPYDFGFEASEAVELQNWVLNPGTDATKDSIDRWCVGNVLHSDGQRGLYISNDGGLTANCGATATNGRNQKIVQFAYRDVQLPDGVYYISFDWLCPGMKLYAGYLQYTDSLSNQAKLMKEQLGYDVLPNIGQPRVGPMTAADTWHNDFYTMTVKNPLPDADGTVHTRWYRLYFAWINTEKDSVQTGISGAIDNIQILKAGCPAPVNFEGDVADCDHVVFNWVGGSSRYQIQYRPLGTDSWRNRMVNGGVNTYTFQGMKEGNYDFRVRGICYDTDSLGNTDTIFSPYVYLSNFTVFCPELHCVNYINIKDTTVARCTYGNTNSGGYDKTYMNAYQTEGCVDYGWESILSRHTICWDTLATDPRTNDQLRMVPKGASASVRLGNWETSYGAEAITYDFYVDGSNSIILLNYAIVLENPSSHDGDEMPRFVLQVFDSVGQPIDPTCGKVDLNPTNEADWKTVGSGYSSVVYKDWTTMGLNLDQYVGQKLKISVATYDCFLSAHYGYAYFTIDCTTARIKNTACGQQQSMLVSAPEGFFYEWRPKGLSDRYPAIYDTREVTIGINDASDWTCKLISTENSDCSFELSVNTTARYPQAEFQLEYSPVNCENRFVVTNSSYIWTNVDGKRQNHRDDVCDEFEWDFGVGDEGITSETNPGYFVFPEEGGWFKVSLAAMIGAGEGACRSVVDTLVFVPGVGDTELNDTITICEGGYYEFHGERLFLEEPGEKDFLYQGKNQFGCMSNDRLHLVVAANSSTILPDTTVCYGETVTLGSDSRTTTGNLAVRFPNIYGCDSLVGRHVTVLAEIAPELSWQEIDEEHEFASITVTMPGDSTCTYFEFEGQRYTASTVLDNLTGGDYELLFYNDFGCVEPHVVSLKAGCLRNMVFQRWDDVLSLKNADNNGGFTFRSYQWCINGEPIEGAVKSYYYQAGGLTPGAEYTCRVVIEDGTEFGKEDETCAFVPTLALGAPAVSPTLLHNGEMMTISVPEKASAVCHSAMGLRMFETDLHEGDNYLVSSLPQGVYVLTVKMTDGNRAFRIVIE